MYDARANQRRVRWISYIDDLHATAVCCDIRDTVAYSHALRNPSERHRAAGGGVRWIADIDNLEFLIEGDQVGSLPYNLDLPHFIGVRDTPACDGMGWVADINWRYSKSELAMERPRVWTSERREKLLLMVTLVYAFLLSLLASEWEELPSWLLRTWCHRTGKRSREVAAPLYGLRSALSRLWQAYL